ncbi:MAG: excinuclease ABC subunit A [Bacteroidetes bacterium]|nr:excinuclease ABC subunit A [Bacteroidota bacterium]
MSEQKQIIIRGARVNNLKNISLTIPHNKLVVITGVSGSGKSSLAFDTLYAEGQRRYVESLSAYARQFLGRMSKPDVDLIHGIAPAIAIEQKVNTSNPRSTVGTSTEIYEYLKLLFARIGKTYSPISGQLVKRHSVTNVVDFILSQPDETRVMIACPLINGSGKNLQDKLSLLLQQGFSRLLMRSEVVRIDDAIQSMPDATTNGDILLLIDRIAVRHAESELASRLADSVQTAFFEGHGSCIVFSQHDDITSQQSFSHHFEQDGITFEDPSVNLFSFNNPYGACKTCEGFGSIIGIDEDLVVPDRSLSIYEDTVACWKGEKMSEWKNRFIAHTYQYKFPVHTPYAELTPDELDLLWHGRRDVDGIDDFFKMVESNLYKIQYRVMLSRYRGKTVCPECKGTRLRKDANYVKVADFSISDMVMMPVSRLKSVIETLELSDYDRQVSERILLEISSRLSFMCETGLGYLTLNRLSSTLSGGESQRINLATSLGSNLVGSLYILDEPSIGLHPRDTHRLIHTLKKLRDLGNTVLVVEHDEEVIKAADHIIDIGPLAGEKGGELVFEGNLQALLQDHKSFTARYLNHQLNIPVPETRRRWKDAIVLHGVRENNLKCLTVRFPLNTFSVVTGVSGSGKTSLVKRVLYAALRKMHQGYGEKTGRFDSISGDYTLIGAVELVDQNPIGRSSRSNPATYLKAYDEIRDLFAEQPLSRLRGYKPGFFSFNVAGGRCDECEGDGVVKIGMQFMADIYLTCDSCKGKKFKDEVLEIKYRNKTITDILDLTIDEAITFFSDGMGKPGMLEKRIITKLNPLQEVGLGYLRLGQSSSTLSGGEAQRVKLAFFLSKGNTDKQTLFIFDEPTTGLHYYDIHKLIESFHALLNQGHSIIVIEHNMEVIKCADWLIDLGKEGGDEGGYIVFEGTPEEMVKCKESYTGMFLKEKIL